MKGKQWYEFYVTELDDKGVQIMSTRVLIARVKSLGLAYNVKQKLAEVYPGDKFSLEMK